MKKLIVFSMLFLFCSSPSYAETFNVNTTGDCISSPPGIMCLREAIILANTNTEDDQINIPAGHYILSMPGRNEDSGGTGDLDILDTVTIIGEDSANTIIDANNHDRVFHITNLSAVGTSATLTNLTIQNGQTDESDGDENAAGLLNDRRTVILNKVIIQNNQVIGDEGSSIGGGVLNRGTMEMYDCTVTNNDAQRGGGIFNSGNQNIAIHRSTINNNTARAGGGLVLYGTFLIKNSTIHNNTADSYSTGGILVGEDAIGSIYFSTISNNRAAIINGGIYLQGNNLVGITGSIISENRIDINNNLINCSLTVPFTSSVYNLEDGDSCGFAPAENLINTNPKLGGLSGNGGFTHTLPLLSGSPAIDAVTATVGLVEDQRGKRRPKGQYTDIGAYEYYGPVCFPVRGTNGESAIICM